MESQFKISEDQIESAWQSALTEAVAAHEQALAIAEANQEAVQEAEQDAEQDLLYLAHILPAAQPAPIEEPEPENPVEDDGWGLRAVPSDPDDGWGCAPPRSGDPPHDPWSGW